MTSKRYNEEVAEIEKLDPSNIFLPSLRVGHTATTEAYLVAAWKLVNKRMPQAPTKMPQDATTKPPHPEALNDLFRKKGHIHREMRKIKSTMLMATTVTAERKRIMLQLDEMQSEWAVIQRQIRVWEISGELPTVTVQVHDAEASLQERIADLGSLTDLELAARLNTARSSHSRMLKQIEKSDPTIMQKEHARYKNWLRMEQQLKRYEGEKNYIEAQLKRRKESVKTDG